MINVWPSKQLPVARTSCVNCLCRNIIPACGAAARRTAHCASAAAAAAGRAAPVPDGVRLLLPGAPPCWQTYHAARHPELRRYLHSMCHSIKLLSCGQCAESLCHVACVTSDHAVAPCRRHRVQVRTNSMSAGRTPCRCCSWPRAFSIRS